MYFSILEFKLNLNISRYTLFKLSEVAPECVYSPNYLKDNITCKIGLFFRRKQCVTVVTNLLIKMSNGRKRLSGNQYAKLREEKNKKIKLDIENSKKIKEFFKPTVTENENSLDTNAQDTFCSQLVEYNF